MTRDELFKTLNELSEEVRDKIKNRDDLFLLYVNLNFKILSLIDDIKNYDNIEEKYGKR